MEYFKSGLKSVLSTPLQAQPISGADTVDRLLERVRCSTLLEDRRDACRALKALSRQYRVHVGAHGMDVLLQVLEMDRADNEIVALALDTLCNVMSPEEFLETEQTTSAHSNTNLGEQFTEIFIKQPDNVGLVLGFLEEYDFHVRWPALKLLTTLLQNRARDLQEIILVSPMGVSKLMDLLGDSREVIRNDTLILLDHLTKGNANIQKIVAFENAFDRLFDVIGDEGYGDGGIVVEDCLLIIQNLLKNNISNQNFFKEGNYIQRLSPMFSLSPDGDEAGWSAQKVSNILRSLHVVRMLVMPGSPAQVTSSCQKALKSSGILEALCNILMASGVPVDVLSETINAVAEIIRGNISNQEFFQNFMAPSNPPSPAVVILLMSMVNEKQSLELRCAVLYCFQCYLYRNEFAQAQLVQTLLPSEDQVHTLTTGHLLVSGLLSRNVLSTWLSAVALSHCLVENPAQKEQLLRVSLAMPGSDPQTLLQQCVTILQETNKIQSKIGILMLLAMWLSHCPRAVKELLSSSTCIPYLTAQVGASEHQEDEELFQGLCAFLMGICVTFNDDSIHSYTRESLCQLIIKRIGLEIFLDKLGEVSKHELYGRAYKHPMIHVHSQCNLLLDHEFCKLFKAFEAMIVKNVTPKDGNGHNGGTELTLTSSESGLLLQYKELIRSQDRDLQDLKKKLAEYEQGRQASQAHIEELNATVAQLRDHARLLSAAANTGVTTVVTDQQQMPANNDIMLQLSAARNEALHWRMESEALHAHIKLLEQQLTSQNSHPITEPSSTNGVEQMFKNLNVDEDSKEKDRKIKELEQEVEKLSEGQKNLLELLSDQDSKIMQLKDRLLQLGQKVEFDNESEDTNSYQGA